MSHPLPDHVESILPQYNRDILQMLAECNLKSDDARETFSRSVKRKFMEGIHRAFADKALAFLVDTFGTDAKIAEALGLKDRTSISHMRKNRRIEGSILTFIIREFRLAMPSDDVCDKSGYVAAVPYVRKAQRRGDSDGDEFDLEYLECLLRVLSNKSWREAQRSKNANRCENIGISILDEVHKCIQKPWRVRSVPVLEQTIRDWCEPFLLCAWIMNGEEEMT
jgi:hypothetical protein